jgi:WD40 repeat protein
MYTYLLLYAVVDIVSLVRNKVVRVWDVNTGDISAEFFLGHTEDVLCLGLSPSGFA